MTKNGKRRSGETENHSDSSTLPLSDSTFLIISKREDEVPGTHLVKYSSAIDDIEIKHTAHNRKGFALGAVMAAEFVKGKKGIFGMNADGFRKYIEHIADRRLSRVGLPRQYNTPNPFPWMSEAIDLSKEKNFFETRVTEYSVGGTLEW